MPIDIKKNERPGQSSGGKRADLGDRYFRSSWEANYARYLNLLKSQGRISAWEYEPHTFEFKTIKRGTRFYTPDFLVRYPAGHWEWHEVKGFMDPKSKTRLSRMAHYFPSEVVRVIDAAWFRVAAKTAAFIVPGWEFNGRPKPSNQLEKFMEHVQKNRR